MGRLSSYAKNRILKLRFKKNKRIIHIVEILKNDDNIKVSRQAVSTFLKKYLETNSIYDKPRTGRKRKLTPEEIQLIGQVTRLNRDITARAIKEYLNLNVSTYTILRATKLFEWNKVNPNSNDSKKAAAIERQHSGLNGTADSSTLTTTGGEEAAALMHSTDETAADIVSCECKLKKKSVVRRMGVNQNQSRIGRRYKKVPSQDMNTNEIGIADDSAIATAAGDEGENLFDYADGCDEEDEDGDDDEVEKIQLKPLVDQEMKKGGGDVEKRPYSIERKSSKPRHTVNSIPDFEKINLNLIAHQDLIILKNLSCSPMSFATKILFKIFKIEELHGHNVSGKTLNKNLKAKLPLDPLRVGYIKYLVETYYNEQESKQMLCGVTSSRQDLWKSCHTAINKAILISERKAEAAAAAGKPFVFCDPTLENFNKRSQYHRDIQAKTKEEPSSPHNFAMNSSCLDTDSDSDSDVISTSAKQHNSTKHQRRRANHQSTEPKRTSLPRASKTNSRRVVQYEEDDEVEGEINHCSNGSKFPEDGDDEGEDGDETEEEVELIQNRSLSRSKSAGKKQAGAINKIQHAASSEASAAANIAAAMKKRLVVVAGSPASQTFESLRHPKQQQPTTQSITSDNNNNIRLRLRTRTTKQEKEIHL